MSVAKDSTEKVGDMLKTAYREGYYGMMDDTAKGLDVGINFAILNDRAIDEAVNAKWNGKRFSQRIWGNTDRLAREAQELVARAVISGESYAKTSGKLADAFEVEKFRATTLIRTETAHIHAAADKKAYEDLGIEEYKYLATLDDRTCETCQALDGRVFKVSAAREGVNYPTMHPRCRCTTTINKAYLNRRARDPLNGKSELVDGSLTYEEWKNGLSPEQREALDSAMRKDSRASAEKLKAAVDKSGKDGIMDMRGGTVALENQRYGRNKSTLINNTYIDSGEYRRKFDNLTPNVEVNRVLYSKAKEMLKHRSGTLYEDMYWIDGDTGKIIASALNEQNESEVAYSNAVKRAIRNKDNLIAMHTHPHSMPPSAADFNSCYKNNYESAFVICHNGKIFEYAAYGEVDTRLYNAYIKECLIDGDTSFNAQIKALKKFKQNKIIDFWEVE